MSNNLVIPKRAKKVFTGVVFDIYQWQQKQFDGSYRTFEKLRRPDTVLILPVTIERKIIITLQSQPGEKTEYKLPGGRVEKDEKPVDCARRELLEETGYTSEDIVPFYSVQPQPKIDWSVHVFIARKCTFVKQQSLESGEKIITQLIDFKELVDMVLSGKFDREQELSIEILKACIDKDKMQKLKNLLFN